MRRGGRSIVGEESQRKFSKTMEIKLSETFYHRLPVNSTRVLTTLNQGQYEHENHT